MSGNGPTKSKNEPDDDTRAENASHEDLYPQQMIFRVGAECSSRRSVYKIHDCGEMREGNNPENSSEKGISRALVPYRPHRHIDLSNLPDTLPPSMRVRLQFAFTFYVVSVVPRFIPYFKNNRPWWSSVIPGLKVGAIPIMNWDHGSLLLNDCLSDGKALGLIVSCCEDFELAGSGLGIVTPIPPRYWLEKKANHLQVKMPDFTGGVPLEQIHLSVKEIHKTIQDDKTAYVHCKAGRGRSIVMVVCYLMQFLDLSPDEAITLVSEKRSEVSLSKAQYEFIEAYRVRYKTELAPLQRLQPRAVADYDPDEIPSFVSTPSWLASSLWYMLTFFKRQALTYHYRLLEQMLTQSVRPLLQQLNPGQLRILHAGLSGETPTTSDLVYYYPIYAAAQTARERQLPQIEALTEELENKLKLK